MRAYHAPDGRVLASPPTIRRFADGAFSTLAVSRAFSAVQGAPPDWAVGQWIDPTATPLRATRSKNTCRTPTTRSWGESRQPFGCFESARHVFFFPKGTSRPGR